MGKVEGRVAIITGGARDLGRAVSLRLAEEGAKVVINYFDNYDDAQQTLAMVRAAGGEGITVQGDMTKPADVKRLFQECGRAFGGRLHILVNVVGGLVGRHPIIEQTDEWYDTLMDVNMRSVFLCTREAARMMNEGGSIVNFSSQAARDGGGPGASMYATAKAAVMCHTRAMAKELGPQGIRVNAVAPGMIATSFHDRFTKPEARAGLESSAPLRRQGDAGDIADLVLFLVSAESDYITGANIDINGGVYFS